MAGLATLQDSIDVNHTVTFWPDYHVVADLSRYALMDIPTICRADRTLSGGLKDALQWSSPGAPSNPFLKEMVSQGAADAPEGLVDVLDTRLQRLMPGMYPAIPGWHCDDWPREDYHGQPNLYLIDRRVRHWTAIMATEDDGVSLTEFVSEPFELELKPGRSVWRQVHEHVVREQLPTWRAPLGAVVEFGPMAVHRASPATTRGWRWWARCSWRKSRPVTAHVGEQVYVLSEANGW